MRADLTRIGIFQLFSYINSGLGAVAGGKVVILETAVNARTRITEWRKRCNWTLMAAHFCPIALKPDHWAGKDSIESIVPPDI